MRWCNARPFLIVVFCITLGAASAGTAPDPIFEPIGESDIDTPSISADDIAFLDTLAARTMSSGTATPQDIERLQHLRQQLLRLSQSAMAEVTAAPTDLVKALREKLQQRVVVEHASREAREALALFYIFNEQPDEALPILRAMGPASKKDMFQPLLLAYAYLRLGDYAKGQEALKLASSRLRGKQPLVLHPPVLCSSIQGYRLYSPVQPGELQPGGSVLIYVEIENAAFARRGDGVRCNLGFGLTLRNHYQEVVWDRVEYGAWEETYRGPVRDLHVMIHFKLPANLTNGRYHLDLVCRDRHTGRHATSFSTFYIGPEPAPSEDTAPPPPVERPDVPDHLPGTPARPQNPRTPPSQENDVREQHREFRRDRHETETTIFE